MERPTNFAEVLASADRQLARLDQEALGRETALTEERRLREAVISARKRDRALAWGLVVPGVVLQLGLHHPPAMAAIGTALVVIGAFFFMRFRGRHPAFALVAAVPFVGLALLAFLGDRLARKWGL